MDFKTIDDAIAKGYYFFSNNKTDKACQVWLPAYQGLCALKAPNHLKSIFELEDLHDWCEPIENFVQDLDEVLCNAQRFDDRIVYCTSLIEECQGFDQLMVENTRHALAESYGQIGDLERASALFIDYLAQDPTWGYGYIGYADLFFFKRDCTLVEALRAAEIYLSALRQPDLRDLKDVVDRAEKVLTYLQDSPSLGPDLALGTADDSQHLVEQLTEQINLQRSILKERTLKSLHNTRLKMYEKWTMTGDDFDGSTLSQLKRLDLEALQQRMLHWHLSGDDTTQETCIAALLDLFADKARMQCYLAGLSMERFEALLGFVDQEDEDAQKGGYLDVVKGVLVPLLSKGDEHPEVDGQLEGNLIFRMPTEFKALISSVHTEMDRERRKLIQHVSDYLTAAVRWYGVIGLDRLFQLYKDHHKAETWGQVDDATFRVYAEYASVYGSYFYLDYSLDSSLDSSLCSLDEVKVCHELFEDTPADIAEMQEILSSPLPYYQPPLQEFLSEDPFHTRATRTHKALATLLQKYNQMDFERITDIVEEACADYKPVGIDESLRVLDYYGISLPSEGVLKEVIGMLVTISNNARFWVNHGYTALELHSLPQAGSSKIGRNEACPCGSGKKYKKCCGK